MYKSTPKETQICFTDFNESCGMQLDEKNEWCVLAKTINWATAEAKYAQMFPSRRGRPAISLRMALGALIIQKREGLSDRNLIKKITENPYYQIFMGFTSFSKKPPFTAPILVAFRKRLNDEFINAVNEEFLKTAEPTNEHRTAKKEVNLAEQMILDATCSPSKIRYPQDFSLLDEAREKTDVMIDCLHKQFPQEGHRPRTYRRILRKAFLSVSKSKKRTAKKVRALIRKELCAVKRNLAFVDAYLKKGGILTNRQQTQLQTIRKLYEQQLEMFNAKTHRVENRIVSIEQPHIRPIVRGKAKAPVEFGIKYDVSIDSKGHARLEKHSFDAYNEGQFLQDSIENFKTREGHYPKKVLVDKIYRTRINIAFCQERGIKLLGRKPGQRSKDMTKAELSEERRDEVARNEVERFFSREKSTCGAALITTKLAETTKASIALSVLVANLFGCVPFSFFVLFLMDTQDEDSRLSLFEIVA